MHFNYPYLQVFKQGHAFIALEQSIILPHICFFVLSWYYCYCTDINIVLYTSSFLEKDSIIIFMMVLTHHFGINVVSTRLWNLFYYVIVTKCIARLSIKSCPSN